MNKLTKIFLSAIVLSLVIGASVAVAAGAEETSAIPAIVGKNIVYTDMTAIQIAVDSDTVDANDVKLLATVNGETATYTKYEVSTDAAVAGDYVFTVKGIPASAISDEITFTVVSGDKESLPFTYSIAEYFYERLYSDGIINATAGMDAARKAFYETYLANGAAAQELFRNYDKDGKYVGGTTLVTDYNVLAINKGTLSNGKEVILSTDTITSAVIANAALAADKTFTGKWTVTTYGETVTTETVANGADVTSNGIVAVTPVYTDATGEYFLSSEKGSRWDYDTLSSIDSATISQAKGSITISDGAMYFDDGDQENAAMYAKFYNGTEAACTIFEFDFKLKQSYGSYPIQLKIANIQYTIYNDGGLKIDANGTKVALGVAFNKWANLRFEHYYAEKVLKVFVNNEFLVDINTSAGSTKQTSIIYLTGNERNKLSDADLWIDNVYAGSINKTFVAGDPKAANQ